MRAKKSDSPPVAPDGGGLSDLRNQTAKGTAFTHVPGGFPLTVPGALQSYMLKAVMEDCKKAIRCLPQLENIDPLARTDLINYFFELDTQQWLQKKN